MKRRIVCVLLLVTGLTGALFGAGVAETRRIKLLDGSYSICIDPFYGRIKVTLRKENNSSELTGWIKKMNAEYFVSSNFINNAGELRSELIDEIISDLRNQSYSTHDITIAFNTNITNYFKGSANADFNGYTELNPAGNCIFYSDEYGRRIDGELILYPIQKMELIVRGHLITKYLNSGKQGNGMNPGVPLHPPLLLEMKIVIKQQLHVMNLETQIILTDMYLKQIK